MANLNIEQKKEGRCRFLPSFFCCSLVNGGILDF